MAIESPSSPVTKTLELDLSGLSRENKVRAKEEAGRILLEEIQGSLDRSRSPVAGGQFKRKKKDGTNSILLEFGDLRDSIEFRRRRGNKIEIGVFEASQRAKAYGHNTDFEGHPFLAGKGNKRQFIPDDDQSFNQRIQNRVDRAIKDIKESEQAISRAEREDLERLGIGDLAEKIVVTGVTEAQPDSVAPKFTLGAIIGNLNGED